MTHKHLIEDILNANMAANPSLDTLTARRLATDQAWEKVGADVQEACHRQVEEEKRVKEEVRRLDESSEALDQPRTAAQYAE